RGDRRGHARRDPRQRGRARPLPRQRLPGRGRRVNESQPLLAVRDLDAYYGRAHVLQSVSFEMGTEPLAIIGRNGMGKTTLCASIMGITPPRTAGSVRFRNKELLGEPSYKVAKLGIGYVP